MELQEIIARLGDYTKDAILITEAEPFALPGPRIVWCNRSFTEMTGYMLDEIIGKTPRILQGAETSEIATATIRSGLERWDTVRVELKNYTKTGAPFWVDLSITPVADSTGWFRYWVAVQRDITKRKEQELALAARNVALERAQARLERERVEIEGIAAVAQHAQDLITVTDIQFRIFWANPAFLRRSGYALEDVVGLTHCDLLSKHGGVYSSRETAIKAIVNGHFNSDSVCNTSRDGREFWTDMSVSVQRDEVGRPSRFVIVERDVTDKRAMMIELERHRDHLQELVNERTATIRRQAEELSDALEAEKELNGLQRQFVSMVSHELRTPLSIIDGKAYQMVRRAESLDAETIRERCTDIRKAVSRVTDLMESVLQSAKLEQGDIDFNPTETNLTEMLMEAKRSAREVFPLHVIEADIDPNLDRVLLDPVLLRQVISNLISNAGKYSDPGARIGLRAFRDRVTGEVNISVSDSGVGIPKDELDRLFTRFFRASTSVGRPGTGIGLHLVDHFLRMHGGRVAVESEVGVGTTFTAVLPASRAADAA